MTVYEIEFDVMLGKGTIDAVFILRRLQDEYRKVIHVFVDHRKLFTEYHKKCWNGQ